MTKAEPRGHELTCHAFVVAGRSLLDFFSDGFKSAFASSSNGGHAWAQTSTGTSTGRTSSHQAKAFDGSWPMSSSSADHPSAQEPVTTPASASSTSSPLGSSLPSMWDFASGFGQEPQAQGDQPQDQQAQAQQEPSTSQPTTSGSPNDSGSAC